MKELKSRFITAWLYGGWIFKALLLVTASAFLFSVTYTNSWFPQPAWISTILYIFAGFGVVLYLYPETW